MKALFCALLISGLCAAASAQIDTIWTHTLSLDGAWYSGITDATSIAGGGFVFCGQATSDESPSSYFLGRISQQGDLEWVHSFEDTISQTVWDVIELNNGNLMVLGTGYATPEWQYGLCATVHSATGDVIESRTFHPCAEFYGTYSAAKLSDGNVAAVVSDYGDNPDERDLKLMKLDPEGDLIWSRVFDNSPLDGGGHVIESSDGTLLVAGQTDSLGAAEIFLARTDASGNELWSESYTISDNGWGNSVGALAENDDGEIFLAGPAGGLWWVSAWVLKLDSEGELIWQSQGLDFFGLNLMGVVPELTGGCMVAGTVIGDFGPSFGFVGQLNADGDTTQTRFESSWFSGYDGIASASPSGSLAYGYTSGDNSTRRGYLLRIGEPTILQGYVRRAGTPLPVADARVTATADDSYSITDETGFYSLFASVTTTDIQVTHPCITPLTIEDLQLIEGEINTLDLSVGVPEYSRQPSSVNTTIRFDTPETASVTLSNGGTGSLTFTAEADPQTPSYNWLGVSPTEGEIAVGGSIDLTVTLLADVDEDNPGDFFGAVVVRNHSCPDSVDAIPILAILLDADEHPTGAVSRYALHPAFPNPFNAETELRFDLPVAGNVRLDLFDVGGRFLRSLTNGSYTAGSHAYRLSMTSAPSGVYFARLDAGSFTASQKIVLIK